MIDEKYADLVKRAKKTVPWGEHSGLEFIDAEDRHVRLKMPKELHSNHVGIAWAGTLFSIMEIAAAALVAFTYPDTGWVPINRSMSVDFKKPVLTDIYCDLSISEEDAAEKIKPVEERGKGDWIVDITAQDENGEICATSRCNFYFKKFG